MRKTIISLAVMGIMLAMIGQAFSNGKADQSNEVTVIISPNTFQLSMDQGGMVTVHTNIPYSAVVKPTVQLSGITNTFTKADSLGHLVAKFDEWTIKALVDPPSATLTLTGDYNDGTSFAASDTVQVME